MFGKQFEEKPEKKQRQFSAKVKIMVAMMLAVAVGVTTTAVWNAAPVSAASSLTDLQKKQADIKKQQDAAEAELKRLKEEKANKQAIKEQYDTQLATLQQEVNIINQKISLLDSQIIKKEAEIEEKQKNVDKEFEALKKRIRGMYMAGDPSSLEILLNAENVVDFAENAEIVQSLSDKTTENVDVLKEKMEEIADQKAEIESNREQVSANKKDLENRQNQIDTLAAEAQAAMQELDAQAEKESEKQAELDKQAKEVEDDIQKKIAEEAERRRQQQQQQQNSGGSGGGGSSNINYAGTGNFTWPCPGVTKITSYWGDGRNHRALDIAGAGAYGRAIVAADGGKVIGANYSGWGGGYGLYVMIDHGNGYVTVYGHCSSVNVSVGDVVSKGQTIAHIGSTGDSTGPHLHFEVRRNGSKIDPLQFF